MNEGRSEKRRKINDLLKLLRGAKSHAPTSQHCDDALTAIDKSNEIHKTLHLSDNCSVACLPAVCFVLGSRKLVPARNICCTSHVCVQVTLYTLY